MMSDIVTIFSILLIASGLGLFGIAFFLIRPSTPFIAFLVFFVLETFFGGLPSLQLGSLNINPLDGLATLSIASSLASLLLKKNRISKINLIFLMLGVLLAISLLRGISLYGIELTVRYFRVYFYFYAATLAIMPLQSKPGILRSFLKWSGWTTWLLLGIALSRWIAVALGFYKNPEWIAPGGLMTRVIFASPTFFILQAAIFAWTLSKRPQSMSWQGLMPYTIVPAIILLQHRTVWVILAFTLFAIFLLQRRVRPDLFLLGLAGSLLTTGMVLVLWDNPVITSLTGSVQNLNNLTWRIEGWLALLTPDRFTSVWDYFIGQPFGTGYERYLFGSTYATEYSPHNFYVQTFLNIGGIGLLILVGIYVSTLRLLVFKKQEPHKLAFSLILISQLLYFLTYAPNYEQGLLLGFAILAANTKSNQ